MTHSTTARICFGMSLALAVTACGVVPRPELSRVDENAHQIQLQQLQNWRLRGRIAVTSTDQKLSAYLNWSQQGHQFDIVLTHLLGGSLASLSGDQQSTTLTADGKTFRGSDPEHLLRRVSGFTLPVAALTALVKGQLPGHSSRYQFSQAGLLQSWSSPASTWDIYFRNYQQHSSLWLPHQILLRNEFNQIKISISQWTLT